MSINQNIKKYWEYLEQKYDPPTFVKKVKIINFNELKKAADNKNEKYLKKLISRMYLSNEAYIIRNAAPNKFKDTVFCLFGSKHSKLKIIADDNICNIFLTKSVRISI